MWDVHTYPFFGIRGIGIGAICTNKRQIKSPAVNTLGHPITFEQFIHSRILARCILLILSPFYESWVKLQVHDPISLCTSWNYLYISGYIFTFNKCRRKKNDLSYKLKYILAQRSQFKGVFDKCLFVLYLLCEIQNFQEEKPPSLCIPEQVCLLYVLFLVFEIRSGA